MRHVIAQAMAMLVLTAAVAAQETTSGSIAGQVVDAQGLAVPGATVTITSPQGTQTFVTDRSGRFFAPFLTPAQYTVRVELQGFKSAERRDVQVSLGQRVELPFTLRVGGLSETVEVQGGAPTVDVTTTTVGRHARQRAAPEGAGGAQRSGTRSTSRPASAPAAVPARRTRRSPAPAASRTSTSWTA